MVCFTEMGAAPFRVWVSMGDPEDPAGTMRASFFFHSDFEFYYSDFCRLVPAFFFACFLQYDQRFYSIS